jgi:hypothetical protein
VHSLFASCQCRSIHCSKIAFIGRTKHGGSVVAEATDGRASIDATGYSKYSKYSSLSVSKSK